MSTDITENATPKTAAQAWAAIHQACGNEVRAHLEDAYIDEAIKYAEKMEAVEARFPADHPIHQTAVVINSNAWEDRLTPAEAFALGRMDHEIVRHTGGIVGRTYPKDYAKKLAELVK